MGMPCIGAIKGDGSVGPVEFDVLDEYDRKGDVGEGVGNGR
jgi:hypothetical protein